MTGYSLPMTLLAAKEFAADLPPEYQPLKSAGELIPARVPELSGLPLALEMAVYTGVLLSQTSTPLWTTSRWLGPLFAASAISSGAAATSLALALTDGQSRARQRIERVELAARTGEAVALGLFLATSGRAARPLITGRHGWQFWPGAVGAGLIAPALIQAFQPQRRKPSVAGTILRSAFSLAGSFALKWAIVHAGRRSAEEVEGV